MTWWQLAILAIGWGIWVTPFVRARGRGVQTAQKIDRRARWGIILVAIAYACVWQGRFWTRPVALWRVQVAVIFLALAGVLSWSGTRALGRQWRIDAGLNADHQLVTWGPYSIVRHPIYTSMLCLLLGMGFLISLLPLLVLAVAVFIVGTEIRVRVEEQLLASRFGGQFEDYRHRVPAYIPFLR